LQYFPTVLSLNRALDAHFLRTFFFVTDDMSRVIKSILHMPGASSSARVPARQPSIRQATPAFLGVAR
jgi:hypothetical protein